MKEYMKEDAMRSLRLEALAKRITAAVVFGSISLSGTALAAEVAESPLAEYGTEEVIVTAERIPQKKAEIPANITVITAKDIAANHYADLTEALQQVNGVNVETQSMGRQAIVRLNGDDRVVVLLDGRRMNNDMGQNGRAGADLRLLPSMKNIERIEIVKGGSSALYGSDAVGGVINIITKKGKKANTTLDLNTGSWGTHTYEITNEGSDGTLSWFLTAGLQKRSYFSYKAHGENYDMPGSDYNNNSFSLRLDNQLDARSSVRLNVEHKSVNGGAYYYTKSGFGPSGDEDQLFNSYALTYTFKEGLAAPGFLRYFDNYKFGNFSGHYETRLYGVDYQNGWQLDRNNVLIAGLEWHESKSSSGSTAGNYSDKEITNKAVYLQDTMKLGDKLEFVPGMRVDHHTMFGTHWTPKAALNYQADSKTQVYASWGRVFKAPTADDLYYNNVGSMDWGGVHYEWGNHGNENLQPETGHTETLGINYNFDKNASLSASYFNTVLHDAIAWYTEDFSNWYVNNVALEKKHGLEITFSRKLNSVWSYDLAYSYIHTETDDPNPYKADAVNLLKNNNQPNGYRIGVHYAQGPWKANLMGRMGTGLNTDYYAGRSFTVFDFNTSYDLNPQTTMYFKVNNLTNQEYSDYVGTKYPAAGRFFQIGMKYSF